MFEMHDWMLKSVQYDWKDARAFFIFQRAEPPWNILVATGVSDLHIPQIKEWGPSVSVNKTTGPSEIDGGLKKLAVEMQSGDTITVIAADFSLEIA